MRRFLPLLVLLAACSGATDPTDKDTEAPDDTEPAGACATLPSGDYRANGACFGMAMTVGLTMDAAACTFELHDWSMSHGNSPLAGTVDGDEVTLSGGDFEGCTGTFEDGLISGLCTDDCAWEFEYVP